MAKRRISKKSKRRLAILVPITFTMIGFFIFTFINYTINIINLTKQENDLKNKLTSLEIEEKDLNTEILKLKDPEYIAKYAREKYYYSKDGEYVIKIEENDNSDKLNNQQNNYTNYIICGGCLVLLIIFIFIFKKRKSK